MRYNNLYDPIKMMHIATQNDDISGTRASQTTPEHVPRLYGDTEEGLGVCFGREAFYSTAMTGFYSL